MGKKAVVECIFKAALSTHTHEGRRGNARVAIYDSAKIVQQFYGALFSELGCKETPAFRLLCAFPIHQALLKSPHT